MKDKLSALIYYTRELILRLEAIKEKLKQFPLSNKKNSNRTAYVYSSSIEDFKDKTLKRKILTNINVLLGITFIIFLLTIIYYTVFKSLEELPSFITNTFSGILGFFISSVANFIDGK